jgi:hypothetical protein
MNLAMTSTRRLIHRTIAHLVSIILRPGAVYDRYNFRLWEKRGYHITPVHFYYPIPDTAELEVTYPTPTTVPGIDLRPEFQLSLLEEVFPQFSGEYNSFNHALQKKGEFYLDNDSFQGIDPHVYYSMIRYYKPDTIIEIGSGNSTVLSTHALDKNGKQARLVVIDPWPRDFTKQFISSKAYKLEHIEQKIEDVDLELFSNLKENDLLFIDGSHVIRTGGDVCFMLLQILPQLPKGVIIHVHDIYLPFEYPKEMILDRLLFWTEQYLLQAYLSENSHAEVIFGSHYMSVVYPAVVKKAFPQALSWQGGSFWIRKI